MNYLVSDNPFYIPPRMRFEYEDAVICSFSSDIDIIQPGLCGYVMEKSDDGLTCRVKYPVKVPNVDRMDWHETERIPTEWLTCCSDKDIFRSRSKHISELWDAARNNLRIWGNIKNDKESEKDVIDYPEHYTFGTIETIDYIRDKMTPEMFQGHCMANVLKYVSRHKHKNGVEDLKKAQVYLNWLIESEEAKNVDH